MEYMTAAEAAEKWGVTIRQVQRLLVADRIPGVRKYQRLWLIPADAQKPGDPRFAKNEPQKSLLADLTEIAAATTLQMPRDNPDAILDTVKEERLRLHYESDLAYMRGDFELVISCYQKTEGDDASRLRACPQAIAAAMNTGNYPLFAEIETYLKNIIKADIDKYITSCAEVSLNIAYLSAFAHDMVPDWLKDGDFSALPLPARPFAALHRAQYFQIIGRFENTLAVAQTALSLYDTERGISLLDIMLRILCAKACFGLGRVDDARGYLSDAVNACIPNGFITPLTESMTALGGLLEECLERSFPKSYDAIMRQWERIVPNWFMFPRQFTKKHLDIMLTPREYEIAQLVARGVSNKKIAEQFHMSVRTLENQLQIIYDELLIEKGTNTTRRKELVNYIFA